MNEELYVLFSEINPESQNAVNHAFKASPKMLRLIEFLRQENQHFKTPKAIHTIYKEELDAVDYSKLINRYYKLRQQLIEWLYHYLKKTENYTSKEEQSLNFIRYLVNKNQFKDAMEKAIKLEQHCQRLNLFELLPGVISMLIHCRQSLFWGDNELLKKDEERLREAIDWNHKLEKLQYYYLQSYRANTPEEYKEVLSTTRKIIVPYKQLPRFALIYHFLAFSRGVLVLGRIQQSTNALVRHLNQLEAILAENPQMPITFATAYHSKLSYYKILFLKSIFYFHQSQFAKATQAIREKDNLAKANPSIPFPTSEAELRNTISILIANQQYEAASQKWDELLVFHKKHDQEDRYDLALTDKANILFFQFPRVKNGAISSLLEEIESRTIDKRFEAFIHVSKMWLKLTLGRPIDKKMISKENPIFKAYGMDVEIVYQLSLAISTKNKQDLQATIQQLKTMLKEKNNSLQTLYYKQFIVIGQYYLR